MGFVVFLAIDGIVIAISAVSVYETLRQKWETASGLIAASAGAVASSGIVAVGVATAFGVDTFAFWTSWSTYIIAMGGLLGLFTSLGVLAVWNGVHQGWGWYGTTRFVVAAVTGAALSNAYVFGSALFGGLITRLFGG